MGLVYLIEPVCIIWPTEDQRKSQINSNLCTQSLSRKVIKDAVQSFHPVKRMVHKNHWKPWITLTWLYLNSWQKYTCLYTCFWVVVLIYISSVMLHKLSKTVINKLYAELLYIFYCRNVIMSLFAPCMLEKACNNFQLTIFIFYLF